MVIAQAYYRQEDGSYSDEPLKVNNVGYYKSIGKNIPVGDEFYDDYLIIYNLIGEIEVWFSYNRIYTKPGDVIIIPPGVCHKFTYFNKENCQYYWCHFSGKNACDLAQNLLDNHGRIFNIGCYANVATLFIEIYKSMLNQSEQVTNNLLYTLLFSVSAFADKTVASDGDVADILKSIIYIQNNYNIDISSDELSALCNLSKYNFMRKFKAVTGSSVHKFIIDYRMMQAKKLLSESELNIKEISNQVGFMDNMYFSRAFKKHCGLNPTEYKQQLNRKIEDIQKIDKIL